MFQIDGKIVRSNARRQLGGSLFADSWLLAVLICFINTAILGAGASIPVIALLLTGPMTYGLSYVFLKQAYDGQKSEITDLFRGFSEDFKGNIVLGIMITLFTTLWTLFFIIPGIVKGYSYSMSYYIKTDHPEYTWRQCIEESMRIMDGHRFELFKNDLVICGWSFVGSLVFGVGTLWVIPYKQAIHAQFYRALKTAPVNTTASFDEANA